MVYLIIAIIVLIIKKKHSLSWFRTIIFYILGMIGINLIKDLFLFLFYNSNYFILFLPVLLFLFLYFNFNAESKHIKKWKNTHFPRISSFEFSNILLENCDTSSIRYSNEIPYNRARYFSAGTEADIDMDLVSNIFYDARPADNDVSFQEYGFLVTSLGVIINKQIKLDKNKKEKVYDVEKHYLPFANSYRINTTKNTLIVYYANRTRKTVSLDSEDLAFIADAFRYAIKSGWTYHSESVIRSKSMTEKELKEIDENINSGVIDERGLSTENLETHSKRMHDLNSTIEKATKKSKVNATNEKFVNVSIAGSLESIKYDLTQNQINDRFGAGQGHGHAGEQYGDVLDKLRFKKAETLGASHEKHGADRIVNGENIQTKYHSTAGQSIGQCFDSKAKKALYLNPDGSMMKIEVPKDQYDSALKSMAKKIEQGLVPNENNPKNTANYVKKGAITYEQSQIATKSIFDRKAEIVVRDANGKVVRDSTGNMLTREVKFSEKIIWSAGGDFLTGAVAAFPYGVVSGIWVYCNSVWQGKDKKTALKNSVIAVTKPTLAGGVIYMVSSQFAGSQMGKKAGNIIAKIINKQLTGKAKTQLLTRSSAGIITAVITIGPDVTDCLRGRISVKQLVKNTIPTGVGIASGAFLGRVMGSLNPKYGNLVGVIVGGTLGAIGANKIMDNFIESDAVEMIRIAKEEFIEVVMMNGLSKEEFEHILNETFLNKRFDNFLKKMYASDDSREYVHNYLYNLVEKAYLNRELPSEEELMKVAMLHYRELKGGYL